MIAYMVPETGEVLYPFAARRPDGVIGDGLALGAADSEKAKEWAGRAVPLPDSMRPFLERLRAARKKAE